MPKTWAGSKVVKTRAFFEPTYVSNHLGRRLLRRLSFAAMTAATIAESPFTARGWTQNWRRRRAWRVREELQVPWSLEEWERHQAMERGQEEGHFMTRCSYSWFINIHWQTVSPLLDLQNGFLAWSSLVVSLMSSLEGHGRHYQRGLPSIIILSLKL